MVKWVAQEHEVEIYHQDRESHQQRLSKEAILERRDHVGTARPLLSGGNRELHSNRRHFSWKIPAKLLGGVVQCDCHGILDSQARYAFEEGLEHVATVPPAGLPVCAHHDIVCNAKHDLTS